MTQTVLFEDLVAVKIDNRGKTPPLVDSGYPLLEVNAISKNRLYPDLTKVSKFVDQETYDTWFRQHLQKGDILFTTVGTVAESAIIPKDSNATVAQNILGFRFRPELINPLFALYLMRSRWFLHQISGRTVETVQKSIKWADMRGIKIELPDIETQRIVAGILSTLDEKIELNRQMNETLEQMGQALFRHYFIDNPKAEEWEEQPIGALIESALGGDWGKEEPDEKHTQQVRVIRGTDMDGVKNGSVANVPARFVEEKKYAARQLHPGDILIEISGGSNTQSTGRSLYIDEATIDLLGDAVIPASFCRVIRAHSREKACILFTFLEYLYANGVMWDYQNRSTGISNFQFRFFVENATIKSVPARVEEDFYEKVQSLIKQRAQNARQIQTLTTLRDTLLPRLINEGIRV